MTEGETARFHAPSPALAEANCCSAGGKATLLPLEPADKRIAQTLSIQKDTG